MSFRFGLLAAVGAMLAAAAPASAAFDLNFSSVPGDSVPFQASSGDNTLSFSSPSGAGTFTVANSGIYTSFGYGLGDYSSFSGDTLSVTFSKPVTFLALKFGIEDAFGANGGDFLTVTTNQNQVFTLNASTGGDPLADPEGVAGFSALSFTTATITSGVPGNLNPFAIGEISSVPEPASIAAVGAGLLGLVGARRRRG